VTVSTIAKTLRTCAALLNGLGLLLNLVLVPAIWSYASPASDRDRDVLGPWLVLVSLTEIVNVVLAAAPLRWSWLRLYVWPANLMVAFTGCLWWWNATDPAGLHAPWFWSLYSMTVAATGFLILRLTRRDAV
jgi:hypothetical protein